MKRSFSIPNRLLLVGDLAFIVVCVMGSYILRLEVDALFFFYLPFIYWLLAVCLVVKPVTYYLFGLYRRVWRYASTQELKIIIVAVFTASVVVTLVMIGLRSAGFLNSFVRSIFLIDFFLSLAAVGGLRFAVRLLAETRQTGKAPPSQSNHIQRILIVGGGDAGALVARELQKNPQLNLNPVGFLDDSLAKQRQEIYGIPVLGLLSDLDQVLDGYQVDEVIIAIPSAPGRVVRLVADVCRLKGVPFRTMPGIYELLGGRVSVSRLREVDITDLLRRQPARIQDELIGVALADKVVLVTGAGGSIGRELCRQIARWTPKALIMLGHGENSIFEAMLELRETYPSIPIYPVIADVRDLPRLQTVFKTYLPQVVFHAAAHKHVPMMEINVEEAITNNVLGTRNLVETALEFNVQRLVMISTDKAVRPVNVMGATKRLAEMIVLDAARRSGRDFCVVRFGNVLGSRGSVVPIFKRQIAHGGPITITHPDMERYFMTIPEAVYLVLQSASMQRGGEVFVLNMGQQVRILDLAKDLITLSGLEPGKDIEIVFTGIRPGEKLREDLWDEGFSFEQTIHPDIFKIENQAVLLGKQLSQAGGELVELAQSGESAACIQRMDELIPGSSVQGTPPLELTSID